MIGLTIFGLLMFWIIITEGNVFLRDNDDDWDGTNQSIDL
jgi:hypothetical protein